MLALPQIQSQSVNLQLPISPWSFLRSPVIFAVAVMGLLFYCLGPRLTVEEGTIGSLWSKVSRLVGLTVIVCLALSPIATPALALPQTQSGGGDLQISISLDSKQAKTGDTILFDTVMTNTSAQASPPAIVAMNIINLSKTGDVVDPEDWSPQRTQYIDSLAPNQSSTLSWEVNAILDGDFIVYLVAIPHPNSTETSSQVVAETPELAGGHPEYPYTLTTGRILAHYYCGTMTRRTPNSAMVDRDLLLIIPQDAAAHQIAEGDRVAVGSRRGATRLSAHLSEQVQPGVLFTTFHFPEVAINHLTSGVFDEDSMTPEYKEVAVGIERAD